MGLGSGMSKKSLDLKAEDLLSNPPSEAQDIRSKIYKLEEAMMQSPHQIEIIPVHRFAKGVYTREITIPEGTILTGHIHKTEHINILSKGRITVLTENGLETLQAPATIVSKPGTKRVGYAHTECVWTTIHGTNETDLEKLEVELIAKRHDEIDSSNEIEKLMNSIGGNKCHG